MTTILIANAFEASGRAALDALGHKVIYQPDLTDAALAAAIVEHAASILIVRGTKVTAAMLAPTLRLIVRAGAGVNTIDVAAATARGIVVANCPGTNAIAVAELTIGLILAVDRRIPDNVAALRVGQWNKKGFSAATGIYGRRLGVLGVGAIAIEVIKRAAAFGMPIVVWSRRYDGRDGAMPEAELAALGLGLAAAQTSLAFAPTPRDVAERCDVLSIHLALAPDTRGIVGTDVLGALASDAIVINTSRGEVVDAAALQAAVERGVRAGLDVFAREPQTSTGAFEDPIVQVPHVYGTHHIGASTAQAQEAIATEAVRIIKVYLETGTAPNAVN